MNEDMREKLEIIEEYIGQTEDLIKDIEYNLNLMKDYAEDIKEFRKMLKE